MDNYRIANQALKCLWRCLSSTFWIIYIVLIFTGDMGCVPAAHMLVGGSGELVCTSQYT